MAQQTTLGELKALALDYADMGGSKYVDPDRLRDYINSGLSALHDILVSTYDDYFHKIQPFTLVKNQEAYELPKDYLKSLKVFYLTNERRFKVEKFDPDEIDGYKIGPISTGAIQHWYVPQLHRVTKDKEVISVAIPVGWEDFVALHAAVRIGIKRHADVQGLRDEREIERQRIINAAEPRDAGEPDSIGDYYSRWSGGRHVLRFDERYFKYRIMGNKINFIEIEYLGI